MIFEDSERSLTLGDIEAAEKRLQLSFPEEYKEFLLKHNGGSPTPNRFLYKDYDGNDSSSLVNFFHAIYEGRIDNLELKYQFLVSEGRLLKKMIPIANDPFGNLICVSAEGDDMGKVYFWDHELEQEEAGYENMGLISDSLTEFLNTLK